jgi:hypothetical protein
VESVTKIVVEATSKKRATNEVVMKEVEEEKRKRDEDTLKNDFSTMDIDKIGSLAEFPLTSGHLPIKKIGLGLYTPSKPNKVEYLKKL